MQTNKDNTTKTMYYFGEMFSNQNKNVFGYKTYNVKFKN